MRQDIWRSVGLSLVLLGLVAQSAGDLARDRTLYERALRDHSPDHSAFLSFLPVLHAKTLRLAGHPGNAWAEVTRSRDGRPFPGHLGAARALEEDVILLALGRAPGANAPSPRPRNTLVAPRTSPGRPVCTTCGPRGPARGRRRTGRTRGRCASGTACRIATGAPCSSSGRARPRAVA